MSFAWPLALLGLLFVPALVVLYRALLRRRAARPELARLGRGETTNQLGNRRHAPMVLLLLSVSLLMVGFARPQATIDVPQRKSTVVLAFDTSSSMLADDLEPTRLDAAKLAALEFVNEQPSAVEVGVVSFGSGGVVTLRPTDDRVAVVASIERLQPAGGTSLSQGLFASLSAIADGPLIFDPETTGENEAPAADFGSFGSAIIVMFSDGEDTSEQDPTPLAELASSAGIRVFPVGLGSAEGAVIELDGFNIATALDAAPLQDVAARTNGQYFRAEEAGDLTTITDSLERELTVEEEDIEITSLFGVAALLLAAIAGALSMRWTGRMP
jgi:Ca-activated chloride channel family protein